MYRRFGFLIIFVVPLICFIISLLTLYDYGVNWDSLQHLVRGQIYFRYLTTGKPNFADIPDICRNQFGNGSPVDYKTGRVCDRHHTPRTSFYEKTVLNFAWTQKMTIGHPPLNDILLAVSNNIFFKKFGWVEDIQGYHVFIVCVTFFMACIVALWSYQISGVLASVIAVLSLYTYPLLFAEQHFNLKDPAVASYFTAFLYFFWLGFRKKSAVALLTAGLFAGLSLGTKFNILFAIPIVCIWLVFVIFGGRIIKNIHQLEAVLKEHISLPMALALIEIPIIAFGLFYFSYPALWDSPIRNLYAVVQYYREVGGSRCFYVPFTGLWFTKCSDIHTLFLFFTTLPLITLLLAGVGFVFALTKPKKHHFLAPLLWVIWLSVTVMRATLPITALYGGSLRQIMEFIPAVALLSGLGAVIILNNIIRRIPETNRNFKWSSTVISFCLLIFFTPVISAMIQLHPFENLYYNSIAGGLKGAVGKNFPLAANTYGNGYKAAIDWVNKHVPIGSTVYLAEGITSAVPSVLFRSDINYKGTAPPLVTYDTAYYLELAQPGMDISSFHNIRYLHSFFLPVYKVEVDGELIAAVWNDDEKYLRDDINSLDQEKELENIRIIPISSDEIILDTGRLVKVKKVDISSSDATCGAAIDKLLVFVSDNQSLYRRLDENPYPTSESEKRLDMHSVEIAIGVDTRYIRIYSENISACNLSSVILKAYSY